MDERVDEWREYRVRNIRMLAIGLVSLALPLSLTVGGLTPPAAAAVPTATPILTSGVVLPAEVAGPSNSLTFNPVANAKGGSITATFVGVDKVKNRPVKLYKATSLTARWTKVGSTVKLSSSGKAVFKVTPNKKYLYKAVAAKYTYKVSKKKRTAAAAATVITRLSDQWTRFDGMSDEFNSATLDATKWKRTAENENRAGNRWCSVPRNANATMSKGKLKLTMSKADEKTRAWVDTAARVMQDNADVSEVGCPHGVYLNARVSNEDAKNTISTGIVAAEITFPIYQGGHGGLWLRTKNNASGRFDEIDIVEAFGWKKGVQSVLHWGTTCTETSDRDCETKEETKWVAKKTVGKSSWWGKPHVFSAEFNGERVIFRIDGAITRIDYHSMGDVEYSLVMSMLSSDYELGRLTKPVKGNKKKAKLPMSATVNWVRAWTPAATS